MLDHYFQNCMYFASNLMNRAITRMAEESFKPTGLSPTYAFLLMAVYEKPGISQKELGETLHVTPSTITRFIEKLFHKGLVVSRTEGKLSLIDLTEEGSKLMPVIKQAWKDHYHRYSEVLGKDEGKQLTRKLYEVSSLLEEKL